MTRAMILCAGLSTRLGTLSDELPKPLLPVCGVPILRYGIELLVRHEIRDIVINLHHHGELIAETLGDGRELGARIQYTRESFPLGTGGGLKHALSLLDPDGTDEPFVSMNGKLIFDVDLRAVLEAHARDPGVLGTLVVRRDPRAQSWGALEVHDEQGQLRVRDVFGKGEHMFAGVHVTRPSVVRRLPDGEACMIRQGYLPWLRAGEPVAAFEADPSAYFAEHSTPERYLESNLALVRGAPLRHPPAPLHGVDASAHVATTARLRHPVKIGPRAFIGEGAVVGPDAVIGGHAVVEENAEVIRSVVWRGARVAEPVRDAVVTPRAVTPIGEPA
jgi:mannose-1-phosphate guanylyltransferase